MERESHLDIELVEGGSASEALLSGEVDSVLDGFSASQFEVSQNYREFRNRIASELTDEAQKGDVIFAKVDGKVVGMIRVVRVESAPGNGLVEGPVYEIGRVYVEPDLRGRGVFSKLHTGIVAHVRKAYGNVPLMIGTKNDSLKERYKKIGFKEIGTAGYCKIYGYFDFVTPEQIKKSTDEGNTAFLLT